jgi:c-di-GMP-binding flagellar brake protein YcgR
MQIDQFIPVPSRLQVYLNLPNQPTIEVQAAPAWITEMPNLQKYTIGVRFIEMRPRDEETIQNFQYQTLLGKLLA